MYSKKSSSSVPIGVSSSIAGAGQSCATDSSQNLQTSSASSQTSSIGAQTSSIPQQTSSVTSQRPPCSLNAHVFGNTFQRPQAAPQRPPIQRPSSNASHRPLLQRNVTPRPP